MANSGVIHPPEHRVLELANHALGVTVVGGSPGPAHAGQAERELPKSLNRKLLLARAGGELEIWFLNMGLAIRPESPALQVSMQ